MLLRKVLLIIRTDPISRVMNKPIEKPDAQENLKGTLAFEDIWPDGGDYDMNDVIVEYNRAIYFNTENMINKMWIHLRPHTTEAMYDNALLIR